MPPSSNVAVQSVKPDPSTFLHQLAEDIEPVTPVAWNTSAREDYVWSLAHEAGHALMAMDCGLGIQPVELTEGGATVKWNAPPRDLPEATRSLMEAKILLAGYAVSKFLGDAYCFAWQIESMADTYMASVALERGCHAAHLLSQHIDNAFMTCHVDSTGEARETIKRAHSEMLAVTPVEQVTRIRP